jgi:hypothetical protein
MLPSRQTPDLLLGTWKLLEGFGRVPRRLVWDNETGIGRRGRLAAGVAEFCGTLATRVHQLKPNDPESKGIVERRNGFFETSFLPGRKFTSPADFNGQSAAWIDRANQRMVRTLKARPIDLVDADRAAMLPLPPIPPALGWSNQLRLGRDYYVRVDTNDYSVDPAATRLLRRPRGHRPTRHRRCRSGPRPGPARTPGGGRSSSGVGPAHDSHRPRSRGRRPPTPAGLHPAPATRGRPAGT